MDLFDIVISGKISKEGGGDITVEPLSVTQNGEYTADTGKAYSPVSVAVPQPSGNINITSTAQTDVSAYATAQVVDADLVAGNIKKDVNILGITGTYEGGGGGGDDSFVKLVDRSITSAVIPSSVSVIGDYAFCYCFSLESITIQGTLSSIGENAFQAAFKKSANARVVIPSSNYLTIASKAFYGAKMYSIDLPSGLNGMHNSAFQNCTNLKEVTIRATTPPSSNGGIPSTVEHIYVPASAVDTYKENSVWSSYADKISAISE